jgi:GT2 family glycosyltransferase
MISLITCSRGSSIPAALRENISATIGIEHEVVVIDNSNNQYTIFEAYNEGVRKSQYPFLLFMHDDIMYHTANWGQRLLDHFRDPGIGAVGIAGTPYLSYMPGGWWSNGMGHLYLLQSDRNQAEPEMQHVFPAGSSSEPVVVLDGVWFCIRKELFQTIRFDTETYKGFHFYDADISLQVFFAGYKLIAINDILIHHLSKGVLDKKWIDNAWIFHRKWKHKLPVTTTTYQLALQCRLEYRSIQEFMHAQVINKVGAPANIYLNGLKHMIGFRKGLLHYRTYARIARMFFRSLAAPFKT